MICEDGFIKTQGTETITCVLMDGKVMWSGPIPKCGGICNFFYSFCFKVNIYCIFVLNL